MVCVIVCVCVHMVCVSVSGVYVRVCIWCVSGYVRVCVWCDGCLASLWPGLDLSNQTVCLLASRGAGCRRGGSGGRVKGSLPGVPAPSRRSRARPALPCCQLGWSSSVLWMISPLQTLWRQQASLPCHPSLVPLVVLRSSLQGPSSHSRLRPRAQKPRAWQPCLRSPGPRGPKVLLATSFSFYS